jgi:hypothetical protein
MAIAFVLAIAVPIFSHLIGISAALFASWYTYGLAGFFWLHDFNQVKGKYQGLQRQAGRLILAVQRQLLVGLYTLQGRTYQLR